MQRNASGNTRKSKRIAKPASASRFDAASFLATVGAGRFIVKYQGSQVIFRQGDPDNSRRSKLASALGPKAAADRYAAFLDLVPGLIANEALALRGEARGRALVAYAQARETATIAPRLSLDPAATVFQLGTILASVTLPS